MTWSAGKILFVTLFLTVLIAAVSVYISIRQSNRINETHVSIGYAKDVLFSAEKLLSGINANQAALTEYILSGDREHFLTLKQLEKTVEDDYQQLRNFAFNEKHQAKIDSLSFFIDNVLVLKGSKSVADNLLLKREEINNIDPTLIRENTKEITRLIRTIEQDEQALLQDIQRSNIDATYSFKSVLYIVFGLLIILLVMLIQKQRLDEAADKNAGSVAKYNTLLLEHIQDAVISTEKDFKVITWNRKAEEIFGWTLEEIKGKSLVDTLNPVYHGDSRSTMIKKFLQKGSWEGEVTFYKKDGVAVTLLLSGAMIGQENKKMTGIVIIAKDISARKEVEEQLKTFNLELGRQVEDRTAEIKNVVERLVGSEKKYKLFFDNNPLPMWMVTLPDLNVADVNDAAVQQYGFSRRSFLQMNARDLHPSEEIEAFEKFMMVLDTGYQNAGVWKQRKKNGELIFAELFTYDMHLNGEAVLLVLANDVTEKFRAEQQLRHSLEEIRMLSGHLQEVREEERKNIAREIHDELGQQLTVLKMDIAWAIRKLDNPDREIVKRLRELMEMIDTTIKTVRRICSELRPTILDDLGLPAAMEWHARTFEKNTGLSINLSLPATDIDYPADLKTGLFRIYQESLTNIARHAEANSVDVFLSIEDGSIILCIIDDGKGFDTEIVDQKRTLGLLGMKERSLMMGGRYKIQSSKGNGTVITVIIPIEPETIEAVSA